jgi:hypothetical protein
MNDADRSADLVRFLLTRDPTAAERAEAAAAGFDCDVFLIRLLCSAEAADAYGDIPEFFVEHLRRELADGARSHKLAHDLGLAQDDLRRLQGKIDGLNGGLVELLRQEDRIGGVFESVRAIQADFNALSGRVGEIEARLAAAEGVDNGH